MGKKRRRIILVFLILSVFLTSGLYIYKKITYQKPVTAKLVINLSEEVEFI